MMCVDILINNLVCIGLWSEPRKRDLHPIWAYPRNERKQQWNGVVEVYVYDEEWVVEVYDMCDQDGLSEDVWRVMIGSNCQFIQL